MVVISNVAVTSTSHRPMVLSAQINSGTVWTFARKRALKVDTVTLNQARRHHAALPNVSASKRYQIPANRSN
uniref:Secreted protein n=1 Tax=Steinernema glaseri TaxID=37863 RepID=A0A1I7ZU84_9BILA